MTQMHFEYQTHWWSKNLPKKLILIHLKICFQEVECNLLSYDTTTHVDISGYKFIKNDCMCQNCHQIYLQNLSLSCMYCSQILKLDFPFQFKT